MNRLQLVLVTVLSLVASSASFAQIQATLEEISTFGEFGFYQQSFPPNANPPTGFAGPRGIDFLSATELAIADYNNLKLQFCNIDGTECRWFGQDGTGGRNIDGTFDRPHGVEVARDGRIAVADEDNHWIQYCTQGGSCIFSGDSGSQDQLPSSGLGRWAFPNDVAIDSQGRIFGLDRDNNRVQVVDPVTMNFLDLFMRSGTAPGELNSARGIAIDDQDRIIISDTGNNRIQICDTDALCTTFGSQGSAAGQFNTPVGVDVDSLGRIWIADTGNNRVQACDYQGDCLVFGPDEGYVFLEPHDVAWHNSGKLAVTDTGNQRIRVYETESAGITPNAAFNDAWFDPATAGQGYFVTVYESLGQVFIANFTYDSERPPEDVTAILGEPGHRWLTAQGELNGSTALLSVTLTFGGTFDSATPPVGNQTGYGTYMVDFVSCDEITLTYDLPAIPQQGTITLERVTKDNVALCETLSGGTAQLAE